MVAGSIAGSAIAYLCKGTLVPGLGLGLGLGLGSGHARAWVALQCGSGVAAQKAERNRLEAARARCSAGRRLGVGCTLVVLHGPLAGAWQ